MEPGLVCCQDGARAPRNRFAPDGRSGTLPAGAPRQLIELPVATPCHRVRYECCQVKAA
ncbi:hypothetical protein SUDANB37_02594 [Streptomyces sp. enrichment culture]